MALGMARGVGVALDKALWHIPTTNKTRRPQRGLMHISVWQLALFSRLLTLFHEPLHVGLKNKK
jgi:hypothetical protein